MRYHCQRQYPILYFRFFSSSSLYFRCAKILCVFSLLCDYRNETLCIVEPIYLLQRMLKYFNVNFHNILTGFVNQLDLTNSRTSYFSFLFFNSFFFIYIAVHSILWADLIWICIDFWVAMGVPHFHILFIFYNIVNCIVFYVIVITLAVSSSNRWLFGYILENGKCKRP